ncbi:hypothetical protein KA107_00330 [Candidatus Pacearchaeota archaeon]|nr:hypothetical protein [Candidatus Pacearchaeota archaeon]
MAPGDNFVKVKLRKINIVKFALVYTLTLFFISILFVIVGFLTGGVIAKAFVSSMFPDVEITSAMLIPFYFIMALLPVIGIVINFLIGLLLGWLVNVSLKFIRGAEMFYEEM